jgi:protein TonB
MDGLSAPAAGAPLFRRRIRTRRAFAALAEGAARSPSGVVPSGALSQESAGGARVPSLLLSVLLHLGALGALLAWAGEPEPPPATPILIRWVVVAEPALAPAAPQAAPVPQAPHAHAPRRTAARARAAPRPPPPEARAASEVAGLEPAASPPTTALEAQGAPAPAPVVAATTGLAAPADPGVAAAFALPRGGYQVKPLYPRAARARGASGITLLRIRIARDGEVAELRVEHTSGHADLDRSALAAVGRWRFEPLGGAVGPEGLWVQIPIDFRLDR